MTIISSQHYINYDIVDAKEKAMAEAGIRSVLIPCHYAGEIDGEAYGVQADGHHTLAAARRLGIEIIYEVIDHPEGVTGETLLDISYMDGDWYNVETSNPENETYNLIW